MKLNLEEINKNLEEFNNKLKDINESLSKNSKNIERYIVYGVVVINIYMIGKIILKELKK